MQAVTGFWVRKLVLAPVNRTDFCRRFSSGTGCLSGASEFEEKRLSPRPMRQPKVLIRIVLACFCLFSVGLPLDHSCYDGAAPRVKHAKAAGSDGEDCLSCSSPPFEVPQVSAVSPDNDSGSTCLGCLLSQHLFHEQTAVESGIPQLLPVVSSEKSVPGIVLAGIFDISSKRGPPALPALS